MTPDEATHPKNSFKKKSTEMSLLPLTEVCGLHCTCKLNTEIVCLCTCSFHSSQTATAVKRTTIHGLRDDHPFNNKAMFTLGVQTLVPGNRYKMILHTDTEQRDS